MNVSLLLIDDDPCLLSAFSDMISFHFPSIQLTAVDSGVAGLKELEKQEYDIVICDLMMPGMNGTMTLSEIRKRYPSLRTYLMTGYLYPESVCQSAQATGFLRKPLERGNFLDFMRLTNQVVSVGKRAMDRVRRTNEGLFSFRQHQAELEALLQSPESLST